MPTLGFGIPGGAGMALNRSVLARTDRGQAGHDRRDCAEHLGRSECEVAHEGAFGFGATAPDDCAHDHETAATRRTTPDRRSPWANRYGNDVRRDYVFRRSERQDAGSAAAMR